MFRLTINDTTYTCPNTSIVPLALMQAMDRGSVNGLIHDEQTAIEYLSSIGFTIEKQSD